MQLESTGVPMTGLEERPNQRLRGFGEIYMYVKYYLDFIRLPSHGGLSESRMAIKAGLYSNTCCKSNRVNPR